MIVTKHIRFSTIQMRQARCTSTESTRIHTQHKEARVVRIKSLVTATQDEIRDTNNEVTVFEHKLRVSLRVSHALCALFNGVAIYNIIKGISFNVNPGSKRIE